MDGPWPSRRPSHFQPSQFAKTGPVRWSEWSGRWGSRFEGLVCFWGVPFFELYEKMKIFQDPRNPLVLTSFWLRDSEFTFFTGLKGSDSTLRKRPWVFRIFFSRCLGHVFAASWMSWRWAKTGGASTAGA